MALKRLSDVAVGEIITIGGSKYKVDVKHGDHILVKKQVAAGIFEVQVRGIGSLIQGYDGAESHLVNVVEGKKTNLTEQLREQVKTQSLTESLRAQVGQSSGYIEDDIFLEDDDDDDVPFELAEDVAEAKQSALTANLRAQTAQQASFNAHLKINDVAKGIAGLNKDITEAFADVENVFANHHDHIQYIENGLESIGYDVASARQAAEDVSFELEKVADVAYDAQDAAYEAINRVAAIENKQLEEEKKMNLQNELNKKLAEKKAASDLQAQFEAQLNKKSNKTIGGNGTMKNLLGNVFNFGKVEGKFAFPVTGGIALRKGLTNSFVAYNKDTKELTDVSGLTLKFDVPAFKLPVAANQITVGDLIIHNGEFVYVVKKADGYLETLNPEKGVRGSVIPTKNALLNAAFYTVVKTLTDAGEGGFNPMLLMALDKGSEKKDLLPLLLMSGGIGNGAAGSIDPTLLMLLGDDVEDLLPLVLMQQGGVTGEGFNPLFFLLSKKDGKLGDKLPLLMASGALNGTQAAGQMNPMMLMALAGDGDIDATTLALMGGFGGTQTAGQINPAMLMLMGEGGSDMKDLFLMQALTGQNIFGGQAPTGHTHKDVKGNK